MKIAKVRWIVAIFVLLGLLLIGTQSPAIEPSPMMKMDAKLNTLILKVYTNVCITNTKNITLSKVTLQSVFLWFDGEWRAQYTPTRTYQDFLAGKTVCMRVSPGLYRVAYEWTTSGINFGYTDTQQLNSGQRITFYCR
jgi:hypothetical protein